MHKSELIYRLRLLSKEELNDFARFIASPYYNQSKKAIKLFDYLVKYHPVFEEDKVERVSVGCKLFPEWKKEMKKMYARISHVISNLSRLVDDYIVLKEKEEDKFGHYQYQLKAYKRRKGDRFFNDTVKKFRKNLEQTKERDTDYYFHQYRLNHEIYTHVATERITTEIDSLKNAINNLDLFYFGTKLRYSSEVRLRELNFSEKSELILIDEILREVEVNPIFENKPFILIFSSIVRLYETKKKHIYDSLKAMIYEFLSQFSAVEKLDIVTMANNFCIMEYNQGKYEYLIEIFDLYKYGLEHGIWIVDGQMDHSVFGNIVTAACRLEKFEWARKFIDKYVIFLHDDVKENVRIMALCRLEFSMNNFEETLQMLRKTKFTDVQYNVNARLFEIRCCYELDHISFHHTCDAFDQYCRRNQIINNETRKQYLNFGKFVQKLYKTRHDSKKNKQDLLVELEETPITLRDWLKEKIQQDIKT